MVWMLMTLYNLSDCPDDKRLTNSFRFRDNVLEMSMMLNVDCPLQSDPS